MNRLVEEMRVSLLETLAERLPEQLLAAAAAVVMTLTDDQVVRAFSKIEEELG